MRLSDLQQKEVINIIDGKNLGKIIDAEVNDDGQIQFFVVEQRKLWGRFFADSGDHTRIRLMLMEPSGMCEMLSRLLPVPMATHWIGRSATRVRMSVA